MDLSCPRSGQTGDADRTDIPPLYQGVSWGISWGIGKVAPCGDNDPAV